MALLIVQAAAEDGLRAAPGNRGACNIPVSVTDATGTPVSGLTVANFAVEAIIVGEFGPGVVMLMSQPAALPGTYIVRVEPWPNKTWKAGVHIFAVAVTRSGDHGQALCNPMLLD